MGVKERKTDIAVDCPSCGKVNKIRMEVWDRSVNAVKREDKQTGNEIACEQCHAMIEAPAWHRSRERAYFRQVGVTTPRMEQ